jgi:hypothetical protein
MINFFNKAVRLVKYPDPMSSEDVQRIFQEQGNDDRIWQAIDTVIDNHLLDAVNDVSDPKQTVDQRAHASGRIDSLAHLKLKLEQYKT